MTVTAPIPSAGVIIATSVKPGVLARLKCVADIAPRVVQPQERLALVIMAGHGSSGPSFHEEVNFLLMFTCA